MATWSDAVHRFGTPWDMAITTKELIIPNEMVLLK